MNNGGWVEWGAWDGMGWPPSARHPQWLAGVRSIEITNQTAPPPLLYSIYGCGPTRTAAQQRRGAAPNQNRAAARRLAGLRDWMDGEIQPTRVKAVSIHAATRSIESNNAPPQSRRLPQN